MNADLKGCSVADVLEKLEKGRIGHAAAMAWLNVKSYDDLVEIMHHNGRLMPGHQPMRVRPETRALVRSIFRANTQPDPRLPVMVGEGRPSTPLIRDTRVKEGADARAKREHDG